MTDWIDTIPWEIQEQFYDDDDDWEGLCWQCGGDCHVIVGTDTDCDDPINGPYDGEFIDCPCCGGSGKAEDCEYW